MLLLECVHVGLHTVCCYEPMWTTSVANLHMNYTLFAVLRTLLNATRTR